MAVIIGDRNNPSKQMVVNTNGSININNTNRFNLNEIEEATSVVTYLGFESSSLEWYIKKIDTTTGIVFSHATEKNNPTITTYTDAWTARTTLTYENYSEAF